MVTKIKWTMWTALVCCLLTSLTANAYNKLSIPDVLMQKGGSIDLPVNLDNDDQVVALQFTLTVPDGFTINVNSSRVTERSTDHQLRVKRMQGNDYLCMLYSVENTVLSGNRGAVMYVSLTAPTGVSEGDEFPLTLTEAVASDIDMNNVLHESTAGTITIAEGVDLVPTDVAAGAATYLPGDYAVFSWNVENLGQLSTEAGWSERLTLVDETGKTCLLGSVTFDGTLTGGGSVARQAEVFIPTLHGLGDGVRPQVTVVPAADCGERAEARSNNSAKGNAVTLNEVLYLEVPQTAVMENTTQALKCRISRSGHWAGELTVNVVADDERVTAPTAVSIPAGQSGVYFYVTLTDNGVVDDNEKAAVTATAVGYDTATAVLTIEDDEMPQLTATSSTREINEGESFLITVTTDKAPRTDLTLNVGCSLPARFDYPKTVILPAGESRVELVVNVIDDDAPDVDQEVTFVVSNEKYQSDEVWVSLHDNDAPNVELVLTPATVGEGAGRYAVMATLRRLDHLNNAVTFILSDDSDGLLNFSMNRVTMDAGVSEVQFAIGVNDNSIVDGDRTVNVTAAVYIKSCSCQAVGGQAGSVTVPLTVIDNDGPAITVTSSRSTIGEGSEAILTVTRNANLDQALTVSLTSDNDTGLSYSHTVTIPAGETSAFVRLAVESNDQTDDSRVVTLQATADGYSTGTCWVMISNQTLPDAQVGAFSLSTSSVEVGGEVTATLTVSNAGTATLPSQLRSVVYLDDGTELARMYTQEALEPGQEVTMSKSFTAPAKFGSHQVHAVVNDGLKVNELLTGNNTSEKVNLTVTSPFSVTLSVDKAVYRTGETIMFTGTVTGSNGANAAVEVYIVGDGYRQTLTANTDANGHFTAQYTPFAAQMGHFIAGACYPGENSKQEMAAFDIVGLQRTSNSYLSCDVLLNEPYRLDIGVRNPSSVDLHHVTVNVISKPDNYTLDFSATEVLNGGATATVAATVTGTALTAKTEWELAQIEIVTDEGVSLPLTLYLYCRNPQAQLKADIVTINTTMTKGLSRDYPFYISNIGKGSTGKITVSIPDNDWMTLATPMNMAPLGQNEMTQVVLRFTPTEDMQLNVPRRGTIAVNCENGDGIAIPFSVEPVSETTGTLVVDVCDEYTYYTAEAPHVQGAKVVVKHPTRGTVLAEGLTGADGIFQVELPEGYYALYVTADKHNDYSNYILVDPGRVNRQVVDISYTGGITSSMEFRDTEIEDVVDIIVNSDYVTNVPKPIVTIDGPTRVDGGSLAIGESLLFYLTLTNHGLMNALNTTLLLPTDNPYWEFKALAYNEPFTLGPDQSVVIPVLLTRLALPSNNRLNWYDGQFVYNACMAGIKARFEGFCGKTLLSNEAAYAMAMDLCSYAAVMNDILSALSALFEGVGGNGDVILPTGPTPPTRPVDPPRDTEPEDVVIDKDQTVCNPKLADCYKGLIDLFKSLIPRANALWGDAMQVIDQLRSHYTSQLRAPSFMDIVRDLIQDYNRIRTAYNALREALGYYQNLKSCLKIIFPDLPELPDIEELLENAPDLPELHGSQLRSKLNTSYNSDITDVSWADEFNEQLIYFTAQSAYIERALLEIFGDSLWLTEQDETIAQFMEYAATLPDEDFNLEHLLPYKPESVSVDQLNVFIQRVLNSEHGFDGQQPQMDFDKLHEWIEVIDQFEDYAKDCGFESMAGKFVGAFNDFNDHMTEESNSVCSSVSMQLSQRMTMTRQAIEGTLKVYNGNDSIPMRDVRLMITVTDEDGRLATSHEFEIHAESLTGFEGELELGSAWTLDAQETGVATVKIIPTKYAAPTEEKVYYFGGSLSYIDPFTGLVVTRDFYPQSLTVRPTPDLELDYFLQRDVLGDDPFTDEVEPMVPAEFALLINNKGYGDANNVNITTHQPQITENEKGLMIDFSLLNGEREDIGLDVAKNFGDINAKSQAYAQWWLTSSLTGHFTEYEVSYTHVTSYDNPDLSLIDTVRIHELIHGFTAGVDGDKPLRGFLVNDLPDADDLPDMIHFTDATVNDVALSTAGISRINDTEYLLTVSSGAPGWNYGSVPDPTLGRQQLVKVVRQSNGQVIYTDNVWATDRTFRDALEWLYEYRLHYIVEVTGMNESYLLSFEPLPEIVLAVEAFGGVPAEGEVLTEPLTAVTVTFNKPVEIPTFTSDDLSLTCNGKRLDLTDVTITPLSDTTFELDLSEVTREDGCYLLTVQTADIMDAEGYSGSAGKSVMWSQFNGGMVYLNINVEPAEGGSVLPGSGEFIVNSTVHLTATPADGYVFQYWMDELGNVLSYSEEYDCLLLTSTSLTVVFNQVEIPEPEPVMTEAPVITLTEVELAYVVIHVDGNGKITVWVNGEEVELDEDGNLMLHADEHEDVTYVITAIAQEDGKLASETAEFVWTVPAYNEDVNVNEVSGEKTAVSVRYFNMMGQEMDHIDGLTLIITTYSDGTTTAVKVVK